VVVAVLEAWTVLNGDVVVAVDGEVDKSKKLEAIIPV